MCLSPLLILKCSLLPLDSEGESDTDSEVEGRVDGVKSWLSKNKGSAKNLSDDGSLKSSRLVPPLLLYLGGPMEIRLSKLGLSRSEYLSSPASSIMDGLAPLFGGRK